MHNSFHVSRWFMVYIYFVTREQKLLHIGNNIEEFECEGEKSRCKMKERRKHNVWLNEKRYVCPRVCVCVCPRVCVNGCRNVTKWLKQKRTAAVDYFRFTILLSWSSACNLPL